jgi:hypothetical protein
MRIAMPEKPLGFENYINPLDNNTVAPLSGEKVFLLFSIDLVNSTSFKAAHANTWTSTFVSFYEIVEKHMEKEFLTSVRQWKRSGDEVLFYMEAKSLDNVLEAPSRFFKAMKTAQLAFYDIDAKAKHFLYFKGAIWIAVANSFPTTDEKSKHPRNIYMQMGANTPENPPVLDTQITNAPNQTEPGTPKTPPVLDFIGMDIDEGFRMAEHTSQGKVVVDPKIAFLLNKHINNWKELTHGSIDQNVKIINFVELKGIWKGRRYPIIWYAEDWTPETLFLYDEKYTNSLVKKYTKAPYDAYKLSRIDKVFDDLGFPANETSAIERLLKPQEQIQKR